MKTYDQEFYLLGAYFSKYRDSRGEHFSEWHNKSDLTQEPTVKNVRPIPQVPVMVNALSDGDHKQLWGTNGVGRLMQLGLGVPTEEYDTPTVSHSCPAPTADHTTDWEVLRQQCRVEKLEPNRAYELSFPPLSVLIQWIGTEPTDVNTLAGQLKDFTTQVAGQFDGAFFTPTQILPNQLASPYPDPVGKALTHEEQAYNDWYAEKKASPDKPIKGFMLPSMHTCAVVFSNPLYEYAEVSLIRTHQPNSPSDVQSKGEEIIAVQEVTVPKSKKDGKRIAGVLPSALFHLNAETVKDGFYLLRIKFWKQDYEDLHREEGLKLPKSVEQGNLHHEFLSRDDSGDPQDVYSYELHEKLTFKASAGLGKVAYVCGDMITLEETLIQQFPHFLPDYDDFASKGLTYKITQQPGLAPFSLATTLQRTQSQLAGDLFSLEGFPLSGTAGDIAKSVGQAFWENADKGQIPDIIMKGVALGAALSAFPAAVNLQRYAIHSQFRSA